MRVWIKDPLAILADGAPGGVVVENGKIAALVPRGASPEGNLDAMFDASRHVVIPGLINTHHHFFQTLTRAHPAAINKELFPWLQALYPIWAKNVKPDAFRLATRLALTELLISGCTCASDHQYLYPAGLEAGDGHPGGGGRARRHPHDADARIDEFVGEGRRPATRHGGAGRGHDPCRLRTSAVALSRPERRRDVAGGAGAVRAVHGEQAADGRLGGAGGALLVQAAYASRRDPRRGRILPGAFRRAAARLSGRVRLVDGSRVAGARDSLQRCRGEAARQACASASATARRRT